MLDKATPTPPFAKIKALPQIINLNSSNKRNRAKENHSLGEMPGIFYILNFNGLNVSKHFLITPKGFWVAGSLI